jgi:hypothetical protein
MASERQIREKASVQRWRFLTLVIMSLTVLASDGADSPPQPLLLHGLTAAQASPTGPFAGAIQHLRRSLELRAQPIPLTAEALRAVRIVWLVSPVTDRSRDDATREPTAIAATLLRYVEGGGALWVMVQREAGETNSGLAQAILSRLGIIQGNRRTGAKRLQLPDRAPWTGGLTWTTGGITPFDIEESPALEKAVLVPNDLAQKPFQTQDPDFAGMAMILGQHGKGRVAILGDVDWLKQLAWEARSLTGPAVPHNQLLLDHLLNWTLLAGQ